MADIMATLGLNRSEYTNGLRAAGREGSAWASKMEKTFSSINKGVGFGKMVLAGGALRMMFGAASGAVQEFAKYNDRARETMESMSIASTRLQASVGEVLHPAFEALVDVIDDYTDGLIAAQKAENKSIESMNKTVKGIKDLRQAREDDAEFVRKLQGDETPYINSVRLAGDERRADVLAAGQPFRKQIDEINRDDKLTDEQKRQRVGHLDFFKRAAEEDAGRKFDVGQRKSNDETLKTLGLGAESRAIQLLQATGREDEARSAQIAMETRQAAEAVRGSTLDEGTKAAWIASIMADGDKLLMAEADASVKSAQNEAGGGGSPVGTRSLGAGVMSAAAMSAVFGTGSFAAGGGDPMLKGQDRLEKAAKEQTRILQTIAQNTERSPVAIAG